MGGLIVVHYLKDGGTPPSYMSPGASGADLLADSPDEVTIPPWGRAKIGTGLKLEIPEGFEGVVRSRSGLADKHGVVVHNVLGTVDSDYRGEIFVLLFNAGESDYTVRKGDRIAQIVFQPVVRAEFVSSEHLGSTDRGDGGFGSTGR